MAQDRLKVVTTFTVIADMARNVAGEGVDRGLGHQARRRDPRLRADTPQDIVGASDAELILWNGLGLERWFEQFLGQPGQCAGRPR